MRRLSPARLAAVGLCLVLGGAGARRYASSSTTSRPPVSGPAAVVERFECYRCHDAPGKLVPATRDRHCARCHQAVLRGDLDDEGYEPEAVARWKACDYQLEVVPSLTGLERRVRREWLIEFLQRPHDLRPDLPASMPRLRVSPEDARAIADHFVPAEPEAKEAIALGDARRGRELFLDRGCTSCHAFGGAELPARPRTPGLASRLAPDLRHTRARMTPHALLTWLGDPAALKPDTLMPKPALDEAERLDVAAFLLEAPLAPPPPVTAPARLPLLERRVAYEEVERRVFKRVCWHCHSDPAPVGGDGGRGNTGGFGFAGRGLDLGSHGAVLRGGRDGLDVLAPDASGLPRIVSVMLARHVEAQGGEVPGVRGMPLGLRPMALEEIQLVESWIAQGAR